MRILNNLIKHVFNHVFSGDYYQLAKQALKMFALELSYF
jgi:hypothetical protein